MIVKKQYFKVKKRNCYRCEYLITSWRLFGIIPIFIGEKLIKELR